MNISKSRALTMRLINDKIVHRKYIHVVWDNY